jgi:hypothetical protein
MKKIPIVMLLLLFVIISCNDDKEKISIFIALPMYNNDFIKIELNDTTIFKGEIPNNSIGGDNIYITKINKKKGIVKFNVLINDRDTAFIYDITNADSLVFGVYKHFYILNQNERIWYSE